MPTLEQIMTWTKENQLMLGLLGSALIGAMPEKLPAFREFPQWAWTWLHDSAKTFLNFRRQLPMAGASPKPEDRLNAIQQGNQSTHTPPQQLNG